LRINLMLLWFALAIQLGRGMRRLTSISIHRIIWGPSMKIGSDRISLLCLVAAFTLCAAVPLVQAQTNPTLDRHARKMEKKLSKYRIGSYVQVERRDSSETIGALGEMSGSTFQLVNADTNRTETLAYDDITQVRAGKEYIGEGSEHSHRRLLVPIVVGAAAAAAAVVTVEALR
jgi:hypothetical protein